MAENHPQGRIQKLRKQLMPWVVLLMLISLFADVVQDVLVIAGALAAAPW